MASLDGAEPSGLPAAAAAIGVAGLGGSLTQLGHNAEKGRGHAVGQRQAAHIPPAAQGVQQQGAVGGAADYKIHLGAAAMQREM